MRQAAELTQFLAGVPLDAIYASPMLRARQTVAEIAQCRSLPINIVEALRECHVGQWAGMSWDEIRQRDADVSARFLADPAREQHPGGESYLDLQARVLPAFQDIVARHPGQNILILAHNMVNRILLATVLEIDLRHARKIRQLNCCINILQHSDSGTDVVTMNSIWHLQEKDHH
jgi:broad specificity phosphatase PhoE